MKSKTRIPNLEYIGHIATFYLPSKKLDNPEYGLDGRSPREILHDFFVQNYNAYTHEISKIKGYWKREESIVDEHERYEVSFKGRRRVRAFVGFLSELCALMKEESIYLTMGYKSWLVTPKY